MGAFYDRVNGLVAKAVSKHGQGASYRLSIPINEADRDEAKKAAPKRPVKAWLEEEAASACVPSGVTGVPTFKSDDELLLMISRRDELR
jgi:hypothetical protein